MGSCTSQQVLQVEQTTASFLLNLYDEYDSMSPGSKGSYDTMIKTVLTSLSAPTN